ncbi:ATP-binding cassette domain-containing protein, partial [archaeon]
MTGAPLTEEECQREVGIIMRLLGLEECAHTIVGNDSVRGCSGGQKKRVTIAEALITNPRVLLMDEISTGLDSAITYDILNALRWWSHTTRGTILVSLLQPTPETVALFSHLMLLRDGGTCYHGPMAAAPAYFASIGWLPPLAGEGEGDFADWCVSLLTKPDDMVAHQRHRIHHLRRHLPSVPTASARGESAASDAPVSAAWDEDTDSSDEESGAGGSNDAATLHVTDALNSVAKRSAPLSPLSADSSVAVAATDVAVSLSCFSCDATPSDAGVPSQTVVRFCETQPVRDDADGPRGMPSPKFAAPVTSTTAGASSATSQAAGLELLESVLTVLAAGGGPPTTSAGFHAAWQLHRCTHA